MGEKTRAVTANEIVFIPKNKKYRLKYTAESTSFTVVNFDVCDKGGKEISLFNDIVHLLNDDGTGDVAKVILDLELCAATKTGDAFFRKKELMYRLFGLIYSLFPSHLDGGENGKISESVRLLKQTYLENLSMADIAAASHVSVNYFRRLFDKQFGISPVKYRNKLRIERAKELLSDGGFTISEISYATGFENVGYFCRYYRQLTGESPSETRKKNGGENR